MGACHWTKYWKEVREPQPSPPQTPFHREPCGWGDPSELVCIEATRPWLPTLAGTSPWNVSSLQGG